MMEKGRIEHEKAENDSTERQAKTTLISKAEVFHSPKKIVATQKI